MVVVQINGLRLLEMWYLRYKRKTAKGSNLSQNFLREKSNFVSLSKSRLMILFQFRDSDGCNDKYKFSEKHKHTREYIWGGMYEKMQRHNGAKNQYNGLSPFRILWRNIPRIDWVKIPGIWPQPPSTHYLTDYRVGTYESHTLLYDRLTTRQLQLGVLPFDIYLVYEFVSCITNANGILLSDNFIAVLLEGRFLFECSSFAI